MSIITTFDTPCRALTSMLSPDENASRFLVGTLCPNVENSLYIFEYKDDSNQLAKISFKFPYGEIWHLSAPSKYSNLVAGVLGSGNEFKVGLYKLPDDVDNPIEDDIGLSDSNITQLHGLISEGKELLRLSIWHPEDASQLLTCNNGVLKFWDVAEQKELRLFSLVNAATKIFGDSERSCKPSRITDIRWSSLFNCSVVAVAVGSNIYGVDMRIPDSSPASMCWLIKDQHCSRVCSLDFNPNSQFYIASGGDDCKANFWDLRQTSSAILQMQAHSHWIWSIRYNPFHDQLVLSAGGDARVALMRLPSIASEPYGHLADDLMEEEDKGHIVNNEDELSLEQDENENSDDCGDHNSTMNMEENSRVSSDFLNNQEPNVTRTMKDEVVKIYEEHDDSIYGAEWAADPWIFASLGFESRLVINKVPKAEKLSILF